MPPSKLCLYRGWAVTYDAERPVTGRWRAEWHGVGMNAATKEALLRMIDTRMADQRRW